MVKKTLFDESDLKRIEAEVKAAESKTSGEIVVLAVPASDPYTEIGPSVALAALGLASVVLLVLSLGAHWSFSIWQIIEIQFATSTACYFLTWLPAVQRRLLPKSLMAARVDRECLANFTALGLTETRDRTGILIYLSELEHRVEILGDKGIHSIVGEGYWKAQVDHIVDGIHKGRAAEAVCEAVRQMGEKLASHFPRRADDENELDDSVRRPPPKK